MKTDIRNFGTASQKTKATVDPGLEHIVKDVMQFSLDDPIPLAINYHAGVSTWEKFMYIDEEDIKGATYPTEKGSTQPLTQFEQKLLRWMIGYMRENVDAHEPGSDTPAFYTEDGFKRYTQNRRKLQQMKERYSSTTRGGTEGDHDRRLKSIEEHILDVASRVKNITKEVLAKHKERKHKERAHAPQDENEEPCAKQ
eukprot:CAMPEP_0197181094 /NCGR_PEP_ID=MMETSP1423-20130617/5479_1 /TAXON_ID=476441 /ORGANISM="Pseudo-nitzschia heimii, Strain UNC1101" /LENGTH=196 /DNA_ID=CAMNT_0042631273 /DNA_START=69 /DNA_END=659 /DNA_ORIENTATION=+